MAPMRKLPKRICVLDLETSGSGPDSHLLEIGMVMLESDGLTELSRFQSVILPRVGVGAGTIDTVRDDSDEVVQKMHDKNGLWEDLRKAEANVHDHLAASGVSHRCRPITLLQWDPEIVDEEASRWVRSINLDSTAHVALAGSGVSHFDRPFIRRDLPKLDRLFTYWALDVGVMRRILTLAKEQAAVEGLRRHGDRHIPRARQRRQGVMTGLREWRHGVTG